MIEAQSGVAGAEMVEDSTYVTVYTKKTHVIE